MRHVNTVAIRDDGGERISAHEILHDRDIRLTKTARHVKHRFLFVGRASSESTRSETTRATLAATTVPAQPGMITHIRDDVDPPVAAAAEAALRGRCDAVVVRWALRDEIVRSAPVSRCRFLAAATRCTPSVRTASVFYLTDRDDPGGVIAFDPFDGWTRARSALAGVRGRSQLGRR